MSTSTSISVPYQSCNHQNLTLFDLSAFKFSETIYVGEKNGIYVNTFIIDGLYTLRSIQIGTYSFTGTNGESLPDPSKSFHIVNCKELKSLSIGSSAFQDFAGEFELYKLPKLESISINGKYQYDYSFLYTSPHFISNIIIKFDY